MDIRGEVPVKSSIRLHQAGLCHGGNAVRTAKSARKKRAMWFHVLGRLREWCCVGDSVGLEQTARHKTMRASTVAGREEAMTLLEAARQEQLRQPHAATPPLRNIELLCDTPTVWEWAGTPGELLLVTVEPYRGVIMPPLHI